jgi:AcrR family transcriptional regulator
MSSGGVSRRPSYGPTSPVVGERGARTRQAIVDAALRLFERRGFHSTSVDDIAGEVGISRATLYQYFESKEQLFVELLHESGANMMRVVRRLGVVGPTAEGYDNLHWWLGEWAWVYDKYSTMFVQWANVDSPRAPLRPLIAQWIQGYSARMVDRLASSDIQGLDREAAALALLAMVNRTNYWRHTTPARGLSDDVILDTLATVVQLMLFPCTPADAMVVTGSSASTGRLSESPGSRRRRGWTLPPAGSARLDRFGDSSERVQATISRLRDAGAEVFSAKGYHSASVDDIVRQAGLGRGTFYKYFDDKLDLLVVLAEESVQRLQVLNFAFSKIRPGRQASGAALRDWLRDFLSYHRRYSGLFRVWQERNPDEPTLQGIGQKTAAALLLALDELLGRVRRTYRFNVQAGSLILLALLEQLPDQMEIGGRQMADDELADVMATVVERGFLNGPIAKGSAALA